MHSNNGRLLSDGRKEKKQRCELRATVKWGGRVCAELSGVIRIPVTVEPTSRQRKAEGGSEGSRGTASGGQEKLKEQREERDEKRAGREVKEFRKCGEGLIHILFLGITVEPDC